MPTIEDTSTYAPGTYRYVTRSKTGAVTSQGTQTRPQIDRADLKRIGTGRRKQPTPLDVTSYTREQLTRVGWKGTTVKTYVSGPEKGRVDNTYGCDPEGGAWGSLLRARQGSTRLSDYAMVAKASAMSKLNQRDMDLGTAWAERSKTAELLRQVAETGLDAFRAIRRGSGRDLLNVFGLDSPRAAGEGFVNANLAYQYGMRPLINDVIGASRALARLPAEQWAVSARGRYGSRDTLTRKYASHSLCAMTTSNYLRSAKVIARGVQKPLTRQQDLMWSLGLDNPIATAWEVVPYSFIADWLLGVGDWLSALNSIKYYSHWNIVTSQYQREEFSLTSASERSGHVQLDCVGSGSCFQLYLYRTVSSNPLVGLPIRDPRSLWHMANALSLLAAASYRSDYRPILRY